MSRSHLTSLKRRALAYLIVALVKVLLKTLRVTREGPPLTGGGVIAFLHGEQLPLLLHLPSGPRVTPISLSEDGQLQVYVMSLLKVESVRGSSSQRGLSAIRRLRALMSERGELFSLIAVDGPRGPYAEPHPGAAYLAASLKRPLWLCRARCDRAWTLRSWDRFLIPKPFSHVLISTQPLTYESDEGAHHPYKQLHQKLRATLTEPAASPVN